MGAFSFDPKAFEQMQKDWQGVSAPPIDWQAASKAQFPGAADLAKGTELMSSFSGGGNPLQGQMDARRRSAFLDAKDSREGIKAVRSMLGQEAGLGAGPHWDQSIGALEAKAGKNQMARAFGVGGSSDAPAVAGKPGSSPAWQYGLAADLAPAGNQVAAAIPDQGPGGGLDGRKVAAAFDAPQMFDARTAAAPSGERLASAFIDQLQGPVADRARANATPLDQPVSSKPMALEIGSRDGDTERALSAYAAAGQKPPMSEGLLALAAQAASSGGGRGGRYLPGATTSLPRINPDLLPPLNSQTVVRTGVPGFGFGGGYFS